MTHIEHDKLPCSNKEQCPLRELNFPRSFVGTSTNLLSEAFAPLSHSRFNELSSYYNGYNSSVHDLNWTNLMIWTKKHTLHSWTTPSYLWIVYYPHKVDQIMFSQPIGDYNDTQKLLEQTQSWLDFCKSIGICARLRHVDEVYADFIVKHFPNAQVETLEDEFDYCYLREDLASLSGNKYHKKKNHLNQFRKHHDGRYSIQAIDAQNALDALKATTAWCKANGCKSDFDLCYEYQGVRDILTQWPQYSHRGLEGLLIYIDQVPIALTFGEPLSVDTFLVHIEKGDIAYPGVYAAINQALAHHVSESFVYLNREQDLGIEGLRKAKISYHPHHMVKKFDITFE
jgi:hypothetical protein